MALQLRNLFKADDELTADEPEQSSDEQSSVSASTEDGAEGAATPAPGADAEPARSSPRPATGGSRRRPSSSSSATVSTPLAKKPGIARKKSVHVNFSDRVSSGEAASARSGRSRRRPAAAQAVIKAAMAANADADDAPAETSGTAKKRRFSGSSIRRRGVSQRRGSTDVQAALADAEPGIDHDASTRAARRRGSKLARVAAKAQSGAADSDASDSDSSSSSSVGADGLTDSERRNVDLNQMTLRTALRQVAAGESLRLYAKGARPDVSSYLQSAAALTPPDPAKDKSAEEDGSGRFAGSPHILSGVRSAAEILEGAKPAAAEASAAPPAKPPKQLGTFLGVFLPCSQNILGVILFLRMGVIVGNCGVFGAVCLIGACCLTTTLTALSMSAIATNGRVPGGGSYYMISRALGPEFGGAVGVLFFLGTSVAAAMYVLGAVEVLFVLFPALNFHPLLGSRVVGAVLLVLMTMLIRVGVRVASFVGTIALAGVVLSLVCVYVGLFTASMPERNMAADIPGLANSPIVDNAWPQWTNNNSLYTMLALFFPSVTGIMAGSNRSDILRSPSRSIPRGTLGAILLTTLIYQSVAILLGATVTRSGLLGLTDGPAAGGAAAVNGTAVATAATAGSTAALLNSLATGASVLGTSLGGALTTAVNGTAAELPARLLVAEISWPVAEIVTVGVLLSSVGAGIQSAMGAPRLLHAISTDGVLPFLKWFGHRSSNGEPSRALYLTAGLCLLGVMAGELDAITPIITMFFLMCYGFVNMACFIHSLLRLPNWRPRWRYYSPITAFVGCVTCFVFMFLISWAAAAGAIVLSALLWVYIHYKGVQANWGDGLTGMKFQLARQALLALPVGEVHTKNWRPQILTLVSVNEDMSPIHLQLFALLHQLKKAHGFSLCATVLPGKLVDRLDDMRRAEDTIRQTMAAAHVKGFARALVSSRPWEAMHTLVLGSGLGGMQPNTVLMGWPGERKGMRPNARHVFRVIRDASRAGMTVLIARGLDQFPMNTAKLTGTIDVWWVLHDGGLLLLLPHLLLRHPVWRRCKLRVFTLAQLTDNSIQMEADLKQLLYELRIDATVEVVEMVDEEISPYAHERTIYMKERKQALASMGYTDSQLEKLPQIVSETGHKSRSDKPEQLAGRRRRGSTQSHDESADSAGDEGEDDDSQLLNMNAAVKLNAEIRKRSGDAQLVLLNLPPDRDQHNAVEYWEYVDAVTEGVPRMLLVKGTGTEVVTVYS